MFEKDRLSVLSMLEAIEKIFDYSKDYDNPDDFYESHPEYTGSILGAQCYQRRFSIQLVRHHRVRENQLQKSK